MEIGTRTLECGSWQTGDAAPTHVHDTLLEHLEEELGVASVAPGATLDRRSLTLLRSVLRRLVPVLLRRKARWRGTRRRCIASILLPLLGLLTLRSTTVGLSLGHAVVLLLGRAVLVLLWRGTGGRGILPSSGSEVSARSRRAGQASKCPDGTTLILILALILTLILIRTLILIIFLDISFSSLSLCFGPTFVPPLTHSCFQ